MHSYALDVKKADFKFYAAHFCIISEGREKLHGHNYQVGVVLEATRINDDGYIIPFRQIKDAIRKVCESLNERFLLPMNNPDLRIEDFEDGHIKITRPENKYYVFPSEDVVKLPIRQSTCEELSQYVSQRILQEVGEDWLRSKGIRLFQVSVCEAPGQEAIYRFSLE